MYKPFKLKIKAFATVIVWAENEDEALERTDDVSMGYLQFDEATAEEIEDKDLADEKRHAELVLDPEE